MFGCGAIVKKTCGLVNTAIPYVGAAIVPLATITLTGMVAHAALKALGLSKAAAALALPLGYLAPITGAAFLITGVALVAARLFSGNDVLRGGDIAPEGKPDPVKQK